MGEDLKLQGVTDEAEKDPDAKRPRHPSNGLINLDGLIFTKSARWGV